MMGCSMDMIQEKETILFELIGEEGQRVEGTLTVDGLSQALAGTIPLQFNLCCVAFSLDIQKISGEGRIFFKTTRGGNLSQNGALTKPGGRAHFEYHHSQISLRMLP